MSKKVNNIKSKKMEKKDNVKNNSTKVILTIDNKYTNCLSGNINFYKVIEDEKYQLDDKVMYEYPSEEQMNVILKRLNNYKNDYDEIKYYKISEIDKKWDRNEYLNKYVKNMYFNDRSKYIDTRTFLLNCKDNTKLVPSKILFNGNNIKFTNGIHRFCNMRSLSEYFKKDFEIPFLVEFNNDDDFVDYNDKKN